MKLTPWMVLLCLGLVGCSGSKSSKKVDESIPQIELSDADEFIEDSESEASVDLVPDGAAVDPMISEAEGDVDDAVIIGDDTPSMSAASDFEAGTIKHYTVQKNETLMLIAFKLYGNYENWKSLANENRDVLKGSVNVKEGMLLKYVAPAKEFVWNPSGSPYLIRTGDTLGTISKSVYHTVSKWKLLWDNNRPLIKDPNKIFAGFTIYYVDGREVASEI